MKSKIALIAIASGLNFISPVPSSARTNDFYPVLTTLDGTTYKNAQIISHKATYVVIMTDTGGGKEPFTNLPPDIQEKYHFDPVAAAKAQQQAEEARAAAAKKRAAEMAAIASRPAAVPKKIHLIRSNEDTSFYTSLPDGSPADIYVGGLPYDVVTFVQDLTSTKEDVDGDKNNHYHDASGTRAGASFTRQAQQAEARQHLADLLNQDRWPPRRAPDYVRTTIMAIPTGVFINGKEKWQFVRMDNADTER